jgi:inhibitor of cysteine peptidase
MLGFAALNTNLLRRNVVPTFKSTIAEVKGDYLHFEKPNLPLPTLSIKIMSSLSLNQSDSGKTIQVPLDETVIITLPENPTTGYLWAVDTADPQVLELQHSPYKPYEMAEGVPGGGGERIFEFHAKTSGTANLQLKKWREWEGDSSVINRFQVTVSVQ